MWLFEKCILLWRNRQENYIRNIVAVASLVLSALQHLQQDRQQVFAKTFSGMSDSIQNWIKDSRVIGGSMFGKELSTGYLKYNVFLYGDQEIQVCFIH